MKIDTMLGTVMGLLVGAAGGATVGYLIAEKHYMKQLIEERMRDIEIAEPVKEPEPEKNKPENISSEDKAAADEIAAMYKSAIDKAVTEYEEEKKAKTIKNAGANQDVDYSSYSAPKQKPVDPVAERKKMRSADRPYVITDDDFDNTFPEFLKMGNVLYYTESHELVDDDDDTILDIDETVGVENLREFPDSGHIAIRNEAIATDYLITFVDGSYPYMM